MRTNDDRLLEEMYTEGFMDRFKANRAGRAAEKAAGVGLGAKVMGGIGGAINKATKGNLDPRTSKLKKTLNKGSVAKSSAQVNTLTTQYMKKLKEIASKYEADINKLNVETNMIDDVAAREIIQKLMAYNPTSKP